MVAGLKLPPWDWTTTVFCGELWVDSTVVTEAESLVLLPPPQAPRATAAAARRDASPACRALMLRPRPRRPPGAAARSGFGRGATPRPARRSYASQARARSPARRPRRR